MALDSDLVADIIADAAIQKLNGDFAPFGAFTFDDSILPGNLFGRNTVQVEISKTLPTAYDNSADYEAGSGDNANVAVTLTEISAQQTITSQEQLQGHKFRTAISSLVETIKDAVWDDCTPLITTGNFGTYSGGNTAIASFTVNIAQTMVEEVTGGGPVGFLVKRGGASAVLMPDDKNAFEVGESGAFGIDGIHKVKDFTGGTATVYGFAISKKGIVMVGGAPARMSEVNRAVLSSAVVSLDVGLDVEIQTWVNTKTKAFWVGMATVVGFALGDGGAGVVIKTA